MANWNLPTITDLYTNIITYFKDRDLDLAKGLDPAKVTVTNPVADMVRWASANRRWEIFNGTSWVALAASYAIVVDNLSGTNTGDETATTIRTKLGISTLTGMVKGNGTGALIAATASTDYLAPGSYSTNGQPASTALANSPSAVGAFMAQAQGTGATAGAAFMTFHRPNVFAAHFGIDTDNKWKVGGWSMGAVAYELFHAGNTKTVAGQNVIGSGDIALYDALLTLSREPANSTRLSAKTLYLMYGPTASGRTYYLPAPTQGMAIKFVDMYGNWGSNNWTIAYDATGGPIDGGTANLTIDTSNADFWLVYMDGTRGWRVVMC